MAFQPIVDLEARTVFAYEALVRGIDGSPAATVLSRVTDENRYAFDQRCRVRAIELAAELGVDISTVEGTGKDGRVTVGDVRAAAGD